MLDFNKKRRAVKLENFSLSASLFFFLLPLPFIRITGFLSGTVVLALLISVIRIIRRTYRFDRYMCIVLIFFTMGEVLALMNCTDVLKTFSFSAQKMIVLLLIYPTMKYYLSDDYSLVKGITLYKDGCIVASVVALLSYILKIHIPFVSTKYATGRLIIAGLGPNVIARLFCVGAIIALYQAQISSGKRKALLYVEYTTIVLVILATVSTSGIGLLVLGSSLIYYRYNEGIRKIGFVKLVSVVSMLIIVLIIAYQRIPYIQIQIQKLIARERANQLLDTERSGYSLHSRTAGLQDYGTHVLEYWFAGVGYGLSSVLNEKTIHFPILASLVETGVFGLISCCYMYISPFSRSIQMWKSKKYTVYGIITITVILGDMVQPNPNYVFTWFAIFLSMCAYNVWKMNESRGIIR